MGIAQNIYPIPYDARVRGNIRITDGSQSGDGTIRYNTSTNKFEFRENGVWVQYGSGGLVLLVLHGQML
jgi:hypothetical protein